LHSTITKDEKKKQYNTRSLVQGPETGNILLSVCVSHNRT